jgi:hypothetical protein
VGEVVPEPCPFCVVWKEPREKGFEGLDLTAARRVRRELWVKVGDGMKG